MTSSLIDDATAEALLAGTALDERFDEISAVLGAIREEGRGAPPAPTAELASLLQPAAAPVAGVDELARRRRLRSASGRAKRVARVVGGVGVAAKIALGTSVAAAAVGGASVAGVLPTPVQEIVHQVTHLGDAPRPTSPTEPVVETHRAPSSRVVPEQPRDRGERFGPPAPVDPSVLAESKSKPSVPPARSNAPTSVAPRPPMPPQRDAPPASPPIDAPPVGPGNNNGNGNTNAPPVGPGNNNGNGNTNAPPVGPGNNNGNGNGSPQRGQQGAPSSNRAVGR